ncbi:hypothetical protein [uncultured Cohaesibacter sp.]|uniref:hypothetical protein n=1 Tax=uncultured Cohaesibacter sp. TaxID=1002546 RepID=UPI002931D3FB|nr:hypothetical protein [uncultured Cohaesibacter sp.]
MISRPIGDFSIDSLTNRFCYWQSANGTRHIFTQISKDDIASFSDCVLLLATEKETGQQPDLEWVGEISDLSPMTLQHLEPEAVEFLTAYVHLLSGSPQERQEVIADLSGVAGAGREACSLSA